MGAGRSRDGDRVDVVAGEQIVEIVDKGRLDSLRGCLPPCRIVVPHGDQLGLLDAGAPARRTRLHAHARIQEPLP